MELKVVPATVVVATMIGTCVDICSSAFVEAKSG